MASSAVTAFRERAKIVNLGISSKFRIFRTSRSPSAHDLAPSHSFDRRPIFARRNNVHRRRPATKKSTLKVTRHG